MDTRIKTTDYEMTAETSAYLEDKLSSIKRLILDDAARCEVELGRSVGHSQQGDVWKAEITITAQGERYRAMAEQESVHAAIDIVKDEILQQLRKHKGRATSLTRRAGLKMKEWLRFGAR